MSHRLNLTGQRFGQLTVISDTGRSQCARRGTRSAKKQESLWNVRCDCGKLTVVDSTHLRSGQTLTCGCSYAAHLAAVRPSLHGEDQPTHKLTEDDVISIRQTYATGEWSQYELADQFNVWQSCISKVLLGKTWQHVV